VRLFVAVELPALVRRDLGALVERLRHTRADVKWVEQENMHLTLKFLGEVESDRLAPVQDALRQAAGRVAPFRFTLGALGAFPSPRNPRVIWVGVCQGQPQLASLAAEVERQLLPLGFAKEERPFTAHLTLGRLRSPSPKGSTGPRDLCAALAAESVPPHTVAVDGFVLFQSVLRGRGPVYTPLSAFPLSCAH